MLVLGTSGWDTDDVSDGHSLSKCTCDAIQGAQFSHAKGGHERGNGALGACVSVGRVCCVEFIGVSDPLKRWVILDVVEEWQLVVAWRGKGCDWTSG